MIKLRDASPLLSCVWTSLAGCGGGSANGTPATSAQVTVVPQLQLDISLYGHNMAIGGCLVYVSLQNGGTVSKLAAVNVCGTDGSGAPQPALVSKTAGSYAYMNGIAVSGSNLYVTYGWATNPFEIWSRERQEVGKREERRRKAGSSG